MSIKLYDGCFIETEGGQVWGPMAFQPFYCPESTIRVYRHVGDNLNMDGGVYFSESGGVCNQMNPFGGDCIVTDVRDAA